jgi:hypothetical protein
MKLEYITKTEFDFLKDNLCEWFSKKLEKDPDTIFQFSSDLTIEDRRLIYQKSDNFIIDKSKVIEFDNFEKIENNKEKDEPEIKYEIIMRAGRKYYNKLQKFPLQNMGTINIMNQKLDFNTRMISSLLIMNTLMFMCILNK